MSQQDSLFKEPGASRETMPASPSTISSASTTDSGDSGAVIKALQSQVTTLLLLLLVVSGTLSVYLWREATNARNDLNAFRPQAQALLANYQERTVPTMRKFIGELGDYAQTHPDVLPILAKYGLLKPNDPSTGVVPATPDPAP